ncbi:protease complex subunit PrcB family protein [Roseburia hominis]
MKQTGFVLAAVILAVLLSGCSVQKKQKEGRKPIEYTIIEDDEVPEGFQNMIEEESHTLMCLTWEDEDGIYIARGYGEQETSGYSIEVKECSMQEGIIYIHTSLIGPAKDEKISDTPTCPYIVLRVQEKEKDVVFE